MPGTRRSCLFAVAALAVLLPGSSAGAASPGGALVGTFEIAAGRCADAPSGSYLRMILPSGDPSGPFLDNGDSVCSDKSYTPLSPGSDGGLTTGTYQPAPDPAYDADGNSRAGRINRPVSFFGVDFSTSTNPTDLQSGHATPAPTIEVVDGKLSGDLSAIVATWNRQAFNQGSPKPDGSRPGNTTPVTGTYDAASGRYSLTWTSQIVGGPFDDFTGLWHLEGTFRPAPATATSSAAGAAAPGAEADVTTPGAAPAAEAAGAPDPAATAPSGSADEVTSAPLAGAPVVASRDEVSHGWRAPGWLIVSTALVGAVAAVVLVRPVRRVIEVDP